MIKQSIPSWLSEDSDGCIVTVRVVPRASRNGVSGAIGDAIKVRITAAPVDGAANAALLKFMAKALGVRSRDIEIISGHSSRTKRVRIRGLEGSQVQSRLLKLQP